MDSKSQGEEELAKEEEKGEEGGRRGSNGMVAESRSKTSTRTTRTRAAKAKVLAKYARD